MEVLGGVLGLVVRDCSGTVVVDNDNDDVDVVERKDQKVVLRGNS